MKKSIPKNVDEFDDDSMQAKIKANKDKPAVAGWEVSADGQIWPSFDYGGTFNEGNHHQMTNIDEMQAAIDEVKPICTKKDLSDFYEKWDNYWSKLNIKGKKSGKNSKSSECLLQEDPI